MEEIWHTVPGMEDYEVSNLGNVRSMKNKGKLLAKRLTPKGYLRVKLCIHSIGHQFMIHRLVGMVFVPGYKENLQINHINGIKSDNRAENLEWCTGSQNLKHAYDYLGRKAATEGKHLSAETRQRISVRVKGQKRTLEQRLQNSVSHKGIGLLGNNPNAKPTVCIETGQVFASALEAALAMNLSVRGIYQARTKGYRCNGFHFAAINKKNGEQHT